MFLFIIIFRFMFIVIYLASTQAELVNLLLRGWLVGGPAEEFTSLPFSLAQITLIVGGVADSLFGLFGTVIISSTPVSVPLTDVHVDGTVVVLLYQAAESIFATKKLETFIDRAVLVLYDTVAAWTTSIISLA